MNYVSKVLRSILVCRHLFAALLQNKDFEVIFYKYTYPNGQIAILYFKIRWIRFVISNVIGLKLCNKCIMVQKVTIDLYLSGSSIITGGQNRHLVLPVSCMGVSCNKLSGSSISLTIKGREWTIAFTPVMIVLRPSSFCILCSLSIPERTVLKLQICLTQTPPISEASWGSLGSIRQHLSFRNF